MELLFNSNVNILCNASVIKINNNKKNCVAKNAHKKTLSLVLDVFANGE